MTFDKLYLGSVHLHSALRWLIVILLVIGIVRHLTAWLGNKHYNLTDLKRDTWLMSCAHMMLVLGLFQWYFGNLGYKLIEAGGFGGVMKNAASRYWAVEHLTGMIIAIVLITLGKAVGRKGISDNDKHKKAFIFFTLAAVIIFAVMPWPFRAGIGRSLIPGMH